MTAVTWQGWDNPVTSTAAPFVNAFLFKFFGVRLRTLYTAEAWREDWC